MERLRGTGVALVTPFTPNGAVDFDGLEKLVNYNLDNGINYLVALGTTAESATLNWQEKQAVAACIVAVNAGRVPVVLGIGGNNTAGVIEEISKWDLTPFDAILSVSPFYNKPTQDGIYAHFSAISQSTDKAIIVYNVPGRTASNIGAKTIVKLAENHSNIIGVKEAANDIIQAMELIRTKPEGFLVISGDDMLTLPMVLAGGDGVISVIGQGFPALFSSMVQLGLSREVDKAYEHHYKIAPAIDMIFEQGNPAGIKHVLKERKLCGDSLRLPLVNIDNSLGDRLSGFMRDL